MECQMDFTKKSDLSFLGNLCRSISLKRLKRHSFIDSITHSDLTRSISPDHEQHWLSVIFVKSKCLRFIFKTSYLTKDVREFASNAYGANFGQENLNKRMMDEFVKEFCNLMGGGIKEHFEKIDAISKARVFISIPTTLLAPLAAKKQLIPPTPQPISNMFLL